MAAAIRKCQKFWEKAHIKQGILQEMVSKITVALRRPILSVRAPPINAKKRGKERIRDEPKRLCADRPFRVPFQLEEGLYQNMVSDSVS